MNWPYLTLKDGILYDEDGDKFLLDAPLFKDSAEAEAYLEEHDIRGSVC